MKEKKMKRTSDKKRDATDAREAQRHIDDRKRDATYARKDAPERKNWRKQVIEKET